MTGTRSQRKRKDTLVGYGFLAPSLLGMGAFMFIPVGLVLGLSLFKWDLISPATFVGIDNYTYLSTSSSFGQSLLVSLVFALITIPVTVISGLSIAVLLNQKLPGSAVLRVIFVLPWVCAPLALGVVWKWLFDPSNGLINALLGFRIEWLYDLNLALPAVSVVQIWYLVGYVSLFFLAGLQKIPTSVYEAAKLDGAGSFRILWNISLPLLRPTMFFVVLTNVVSSLQVFDHIYAMTGGGPKGTTNVIASGIYFEAFQNLRFGRAAAMAVVLFVLVVCFTIFQQLYFRNRITYDLG